MRAPPSPPSAPKDASSLAEVDGLPKRKKGTRGPQERKAAAAAAKVTSERITDAVRSFVDRMDAEMAELAETQGISVDRVRQMIGQLSPLKDKRKVSNWNVLLHVKSKELNDGEYPRSFYFSFLLTFVYRPTGRRQATAERHSRCSAQR